MRTCPHCQQPFPAEASHTAKTIETPVVELPPTVEQSPIGDDPVIAAATKKVVGEVLKVIQPLLDKLAEAQGGSAPSTQAATAGPLSNEQYLDQLNQIQDSAKERLQQQEQHLAAKLQKLQARFSRR